MPITDDDPLAVIIFPLVTEVVALLAGMPPVADPLGILTPLLIELDVPELTLIPQLL